MRVGRLGPGALREGNTDVEWKASRRICSPGQERQRGPQAHVRSDLPENAVRAPPRLLRCHLALGSFGSGLAAHRRKTMDDAMVLTTVSLRLKIAWGGARSRRGFGSPGSGAC